MARRPRMRIQPPPLLLLLLLCLVASSCFIAALAQPPSVTLHVALDGSDTAGCGLPPAAPCLTLRHALAEVPAAHGATILMGDGTYTGADNTDIVLTPAAPRRIAAANGPGRVVIDAEGVAGRRHFTVALQAGGVLGSTPPPSWSRLTLEGLTLRGGRSENAGSIAVLGDGVNAGAVLSVVDCVFEGNRVALTGGPHAGAVAVGLAVLPGSAQSAQDQAAMSPPAVSTPASIPKATTGSEAPPESPYASEAWTEPPPVPALAEDGGTFLPAVIFRRCVFVGNSITMGADPMIVAFAAGSLAVHQSVVALLDCTFRAHPPPVIVLALLTGVGATWMHRCTFENAQVSSIGVTVTDAFMPVAGSQHSLVVSSSRFLAMRALTAPIPSIADMLGGQLGSVLIHFGYGSVTFIDTHVVNNTGTAITAGAVGAFCMHGGSFTGASSMVEPLVNLASTTSAIFARTTFAENAGVSGGVVGSISQDVLLHFHACTFLRNSAVSSGGVLDLSFSPPGSVVWMSHSHFEMHEAEQGGVVSLASTMARLVVSNSTFVHNDASRQGGVAMLAGGETWFTDCDLGNNSAPTGGALSLAAGGLLHVQSSSLRFNRAYTGGAIRAQAGSNGEVRDSVVEHNEALEEGGAVHDAAPLSYSSTRFEHNRALFGGALFFPAASAPLVSFRTKTGPGADAGAGAVTPSMSRTCSDMFEAGVVFTSNIAGEFGGAIHFDGASILCTDFCTPHPMDSLEAQASVGQQWTTDRCRFDSNKAGAVYGAHFSSALHRTQLVPFGSTGSGGSPLALDPALDIAPGLPFGLALELLDELNRTYAVTGGGATGVTLQLRVFVDDGSGVEKLVDTILAGGSDASLTAGAVTPSSTPAGGADLASGDLLLGPALKPLTAQAGIVSFSGLQLFSAPIASGSARRVIVRAHSDRVSMQPLALHIHVSSCPPGLVLFNLGQDAGVPPGSLGLSCVVRPDFLPGDILKLRISAPLTLLSCFVAVVGMWTSLILVEQIITARSRGRAYLHWVGLSTLAFGFSGAWCMAVIAVTGVEAYSDVTGATQSLGLRPEFVFGALAVLLAAPFLGLSLVFTDGDFAVQQRQYVKGLGKVNKYRQRDQAPAWQTRQAAKESNLFAEYEESTLYETSLNKNSLLAGGGGGGGGGGEGGSVDDNNHDLHEEEVEAGEGRLQGLSMRVDGDSGVRRQQQKEGRRTSSHTTSALVQPVLVSPLLNANRASGGALASVPSMQPMQVETPEAAGETPIYPAPSPSIVVAMERTEGPSTQDSPAPAPADGVAGECVTSIEMASSPAQVNSRRLTGNTKRATLSHFESLPGAPQCSPSRSDDTVRERERDRERIVAIGHHTSSPSGATLAHIKSPTASNAASLSQRPGAAAGAGSKVVSRSKASSDHVISLPDSDVHASNEKDAAAPPTGLAFFVRKALSVRILLGLLVMFAGLAAGLLLMLAALQLDVDDAQAEWSLGLVIGAVIIACAFFYPSLLAYLFLFTRLRTGAIFPLVGALLVCEYMPLSGLEWRRGPGASSTAPTLDPSLMALIAFAISMVSCILLIGINVVSLRLSRHQLSQVLKGITVDLAKAQHQKHMLNAHIQELRTWLGLAVRGRLGTGPQQAAVIRPKGYAAGKSDKGDAGAAAALLDSGADVPSADRWLDLGVTVGLSTLSTEGAAASLRRDQEAAMLLAGADSAVFDSRPTAVRSALQRLQQLGLLSPHDVAGVGDLTSLPRITLEQVLGHPACASFFLTHAARGHNEDSLLAFLSIAQFRQCGDEASRRSVASQIALDHLQSGAAYEVNVSAAMLEEVRGALHGDSSLSRSLFDGMAAELIGLMQTNSWASFVHTRAYWMCALILLATKHNQARKKRMLQQQAQEIADMA